MPQNVVSQQEFLYLSLTHSLTFYFRNGSRQTIVSLENGKEPIILYMEIYKTDQTTKMQN